MATINDGTLEFGSRVLTIPVTTGTAFVAESFSYEEGEQFSGQYDETGTPSGGVSVPDFITGSATLQIPTGSPTLPVRGDSFTTTVGGSSQTFYVVTLSNPEEHQGIKKMNITFRKKYN